ncbi:hypothetical protein HYT55_02510 [Candidatus Woesearchaeota archaeon]|nr:hypothetical protein [Candidatus Woesearchaeota archaeon]
MPTLLACLSTGKGTWSEVSRLIQAQPWTNIFLITNQFGKENFTGKPENVQLLVLNLDMDCSSLTQEIKKQLKDKISDFEVALNLASGSGKEHMALLEAVLEMGCNFRLVTVSNNQAEILGLRRE